MLKKIPVFLLKTAFKETGYFITLKTEKIVSINKKLKA
jgi:hypothetical protein